MVTSGVRFLCCLELTDPSNVIFVASVDPISLGRSRVNLRLFVKMFIKYSSIFHDDIYSSMGQSIYPIE